MKRRRQIWIGFLVLVIGGSIAEAATRAPRGKQAPRRVVKAAPAKKSVRPVATVRRARPAVAPKRATATTRMAKVATPARVKKVATPARAKSVRAVPAARSKRFRMAQETAPRNPATTATPPPATPDPVLAATIPREAEPLMTRALAAYFVTGDESIRDLRARGWEYGDIATAGNLAARSRRPFTEIARMYEERRDWTTVARDVNVAPEQVYIASNSPRYVMIRPTPEEMERMQIARQEEAYRQTLARYQEAVARYQAANDPALANDRRLAEANPPVAGQQAPAPPADPNAPRAPAAVPPATPDAAVPPADRPDPNIVLDPSITQPSYASTALTPIERVASARLELAPANSSALLRRAVAQYYALHPATVRDLQAQGWSLGDVLVAGNLSHRSEATLDEVIALRQSGEQWPAIAERIGVASEEIHEPTMARRISVGYPLPPVETRDTEGRDRDRDNRESEQRPPSRESEER